MGMVRGRRGVVIRGREWRCAPIVERREASRGTLRECRIGISGICRRLTEVGRGIDDGSDDEDFGNWGRRFRGIEEGVMTNRFHASLNHKNASQTKFIKTELTKIRYKIK